MDEEHARSVDYYKLSALKARLYAELLEIENRLYDIYPSRRGEIYMWVKKLKVKLDRLKVNTLYDFMRTVEAASYEFPEFSALMPDKNTVAEVTER